MWLYHCSLKWHNAATIPVYLCSIICDGSLIFTKFALRLLSDNVYPLHSIYVYCWLIDWFIYLNSQSYIPDVDQYLFYIVWSILSNLVYFRLGIGLYVLVFRFSFFHCRGKCGSRSTLASTVNMLAYYPLSYRVPVRERYGSTLLPATREQHDQNCTQSH